eukprot:CAMPEP_0168313676 /NCGR_PEP_ID=MMETSP0210-20121227/3621_1 /TAXON_ID=40633 /ORGANISM="Condylostoma magnum, Strain COL2" /LENGTH=70 /DNA_ID=CAMNT_0008273355 /DNA_START=741 /DNA_END=953 /DNA_ORIENTATION=+
MNRLEKYIDELPEHNELRKCNNIWEIDDLVKGYVSSSDDDEMRNEPEEYNEDESEESEESVDPYESTTVE